MKAAGIVLAAGASHRMGSPKALLSIDGRPAVEVVVAALRAGGADPVIVVVGRHAAKIRAGAKLDDATVIDHAGWADGRTSSLQAGLRAVPADAAVAVVALVDMPYVRATSVRALLDAFAATHGAEVAVPVYTGRRGHPIVLGRKLFAGLLALGPDEPPRALIRGARDVEVRVADPGVLVDLDTPEDVAIASRASATGSGLRPGVPRP